MSFKVEFKVGDIVKLSPVLIDSHVSDLAWDSLSPLRGKTFKISKVTGPWLNLEGVRKAFLQNGRASDSRSFHSDFFTKCQETEPFYNENKFCEPVHLSKQKNKNKEILESLLRLQKELSDLKKILLED